MGHAARVAGIALLLTFSIPLLALNALLFALLAAAIGSFLADWAQWLMQVALRHPRHAEIAADSFREIQVIGFSVGWPFGIGCPRWT
jgi:hypothetical protein